MVKKSVLLVVGGGLGVLATIIAYAARRLSSISGESSLRVLPGLQTGYFHLERIDVREGQRVRRGEILGLMGGDPNGGPRHLHFELTPHPFPGGKYSRDITLNPRSLLEDGTLLMPVEDWQGRKAVISSKHRVENPSRPTHAGVDVMFDRLNSDTQLTKIGEGAPRFVAYRGTRVRAAADGIVTRAGWTETGFRVWVVHG